MPLRDIAAALQQVRGEEPVDEIQFDGLVPRAQGLGMFRREGQFAVIVLRTVIEAEHGRDFVARRRPMQRRHGIHAPGAENNNFHIGIAAKSRKKRKK